MGGLIVGGCGESRSGGADAGLTGGKFVDVVTALREAERAVAEEDSAARLFAERKAEILEREGVSEAELRAFVATRDASELELLWDAISRRLRYVPDDREEPFPTDPWEDSRDTIENRPEHDLEDEPGTLPRPGSPRRGPPGLPPLPVSADTGERRLH